MAGAWGATPHITKLSQRRSTRFMIKTHNRTTATQSISEDSWRINITYASCIVVDNHLWMDSPTSIAPRASPPPSPPSIAQTSSTSSQPEKTKKTVRFQAKKWFLTYPQCTTTKETALSNAEAMFPDLVWIICAEEKHQDGTPHLHVGLEFSRRYNSRNANCFDPISGQHGNYQPMKNQLQCIKYIIKDGAYIAKGIDPKAILQKQNGKFAYIASKVMEGNSLSSLNQLDAGFVLANKRKLEEYMAWYAVLKEKEKKFPWEETDVIPDLKNAHNSLIVEWLKQNIKMPRLLRQPQLYLYGPPGIGKTHLVASLDSYLSIYYMSRDDGEFMDRYEDGAYDLIVMDEFSNKKSMQFMNQILDGQKCTLKKKGGQILKSDNLPVIILSNYSLEENYRNLAEKGYLEPLKTRLTIVFCPERIEIEFFNKKECDALG